MRLTEASENLGLPDYMKFGLELEVENLDYNEITKRIKGKKWHTDKDMSLTDSGTECVSPVLQESDETSVWKDVYEVCDSITQCPADSKRKPYTDHTCGGHIHFDAQVFKENPEAMKNFLKIWAESEELIFKMCNDKNDPIRTGAMETSKTTMKELVNTAFKSPLPSKEDRMQNGKPKTIVTLARETLKNLKNNLDNTNRKLNVLLADVLLSRDGMAAPISGKIQKQLETGKLKLGKPKSHFYRAVIAKNKLDPERYSALNLTNLGQRKKNTIEFRLSNGTIDPKVIKENVFLYASIIDTAVRMTKNPELYSDRLKKFNQRDVTEEEKVDAFLGLIVDNDQDRQVYKDRWESVKDNPIFSESKGAKRFSRDVFKKEAQRQPVTALESVYGAISEFQKRALGKKEQKKEEQVFGY